MDAVSGAAAVISLAIQLVGSIQSVRRFLHNVENAPKDLSAIIDLLGLLETNLNHARKLMELQQVQGITPHASITDALEACEKRVKTLEDFITALRTGLVRRNRLQKAWGSLKIVSKKEDIRLMHVQLRDTVLALQMAISSNSAEVQYVYPDL
ncbi:MAG: hypothetical protein Q9181_007259 [Wetmoreana brouardii]